MLMFFLDSSYTPFFVWFCFQFFNPNISSPSQLIFPCFSPQEQYEFCYKVVQEYIDAFSDYANFK